jgi:hypothetical protein
VAKMTAIAGMLNYPLLRALHFLAVVPLHTARSLWIAAKLKLHPDIVSELCNKPVFGQTGFFFF